MSKKFTYSPSSSNYYHSFSIFCVHLAEEEHKREIIMRIGYYNRCYSFQKIFAAFLLTKNPKVPNVQLFRFILNYIIIESKDVKL